MRGGAKPLSSTHYYYRHARQHQRTLESSPDVTQDAGRFRRLGAGGSRPGDGGYAAISTRNRPDRLEQRAGDGPSQPATRPDDDHAYAHAHGHEQD